VGTIQANTKGKNQMKTNTITLLDAVAVAGPGAAIDLASLIGVVKGIPSFDVTITGTGTVQIQTSKDGTTWESQSEKTVTESGISIPLPARHSMVRGEVTAYTSGTITVTSTVNTIRGGDPNLR
jgi:hypothetical protein